MTTIQWRAILSPIPSPDWHGRRREQNLIKIIAETDMNMGMWTVHIFSVPGHPMWTVCLFLDWQTNNYSLSRCKIEGYGLVERTRTNNSRKQLPTTERSIPISLCHANIISYAWFL